VRRAAALIWTLAIWPAAAAAQQVGPPEVPVVVTIGEGRLKRAPDRAWVTISAESRAKTPTDAQKLNADAMGTVMQKLRIGAAAGSDSHVGVELHPEFDYVNNKQTPAATSRGIPSKCVWTNCQSSGISSIWPSAPVRPL
jgi:uncharacterized protein YggE